MRRDIVCHRCGFPVRRGVIPIIWPNDETGTGRAVWCSLNCWEQSAKRRMAEPMRSAFVHAESKMKDRSVTA